MGNFFYDEQDELAETLDQQAEKKAEFCLVTGIAPSEYEELTIREIEAFVRVYKRLHKN
jgi:hypothetical protein